MDGKGAIGVENGVHAHDLVAGNALGQLRRARRTKGAGGVRIIKGVGIRSGDNKTMTC